MKEAGIEMAIIAVPATVAQYIVDDIVAIGIKAILNFAPINLKVPDDVYLRNENMSMELEYLSFAMVNKHTEKRPKYLRISTAMEPVPSEPPRFEPAASELLLPHRCSPARVCQTPGRPCRGRPRQ